MQTNADHIITIVMIISWHGNAFHIAKFLSGESWQIPLTNAQLYRALILSLLLTRKVGEQPVNLLMIWEAMTLKWCRGNDVEYALMISHIWVTIICLKHLHNIFISTHITHIDGWTQEWDNSPPSYRIYTINDFTHLNNCNLSRLFV